VPFERPTERRTRLGPGALLARARERSWRWVPAALLPLWLRTTEPRRVDLGPLGERLAAHLLAREGHRVLARNVRIGGVEVDVLARSSRTLVLCEVKASRSRLDLPLGARRYRPADRVGPARLERLATAARGLARSSNVAAQVDLIEVWIRGPRRRVEYGWRRAERGPTPTPGAVRRPWERPPPP
jgi:putative endonuclease